MPHAIPDLAARGLTLIQEFLTAAEEQTLIPLLLVPEVVGLRTQPKRNRVQRYGSAVPYNSHILSATIPAHFLAIGRQLVVQQLLPTLPDSVTINEYLKGDIIPAHVDAPAGGPVITVLSLGGHATMLLKRQEKSYTVALPPRSLLQLRDELRYKWTHEITPVAATRYSVVFRCSKTCTGESTCSAFVPPVNPS